QLARRRAAVAIESVAVLALFLVLEDPVPASDLACPRGEQIRAPLTGLWRADEEGGLRELSGDAELGSLAARRVRDRSRGLVAERVVEQIGRPAGARTLRAEIRRADQHPRAVRGNRRPERVAHRGSRRRKRPGERRCPAVED